jgi:hypothetical protein
LIKVSVQTEIGERRLLLQDLAFSGLGITKIHHFVHEFIDNDKVVAYALLLELLEVLDKNLGKAMEEQDDLCGIRVAPGEGEYWSRVRQAVTRRARLTVEI